MAQSTAAPPELTPDFNQIREGVRRFRSKVFPEMRTLYERLAEKQEPQALFLTCGDSRIEPSLLTGTQPGQIFVERTPGNIVPIYDDNASVGVSSSIEYAASVLSVKTFIICGHSSCGAMKALLHPQELEDLPATARWLRYAQPAVELLDCDHSGAHERDRVTRLSELNVLKQMEHLHSHPAVARRVQRGDLAIQGWFYEIHTGTVAVFNPKKGQFEPWPEED